MAYLKKPSPAQIRELCGPVGFGEKILGMKFYPKQKAVLESLAPADSVVSFVSCNEGGKTTRVIAAAVLWHMFMFTQGKIVSTSGSFRQIKDQLVPALHRYRDRFPSWQFRRIPRIDTEDPNCFYEGFSTNDAGKFEGHHEDKERGNDAPLMIIVDEAKTVRDPIFEAIERCKPTRLLVCSSPGAPEGEFYRSHTSRAKFYTRIKQTALECPHITPEWIGRQEEKWGKDHPLVKSMIWAEFMETVEDAIINLSALEDLLAEPPEFKRDNDRKGFCDFAAGGDENVFAQREGNRITIEAAWREKNTMNAVGRFITEFNRVGLRPEQIEGDDGGVGHAMIDALAEAGWPIWRANNESAPRRDPHFANLGAETWHMGNRSIERREFILPEDEDLRGQLMSRKKKYDSKGRMAIESKKDMKARGLPSPDRADAVLGAMAPLVRQVEYGVNDEWGPWGNMGQENLEPAGGGYAESHGFWAGEG